jgi:CMP-2-keto-3-deoxyoctulosonic acid synthetase
VLQALVEIASSVSQGQAEMEFINPNTVVITFPNAEQTALFSRLIQPLPLAGVILLETEIVVSW